MTAIVAGSAVIYGWWAHGWQGLALAVCAAAIWAWLQFRRERRLLEAASARPPGRIDSVVMMQAHLAHGMQMPEVVALAGCLGRRYSAQDEWQWVDALGNEIVVTFRRGVVVRWAVARREAAPVPVEAGHDMPPEDDQRAQFTALVAQAKTA